MDAVRSRNSSLRQRREPSFAQAIVLEPEWSLPCALRISTGRASKNSLAKTTTAISDARCRAGRWDRPAGTWSSFPPSPALKRWASRVASFSNFSFPSADIFEENGLQFGFPQRGPHPPQRVSEGGEEGGNLFLDESSTSRANKPRPGPSSTYFDFRSSALERLPYLETAAPADVRRRTTRRRGTEVSGFAELFGVGGIVTMGRMVEANLHVARKRDGATRRIPPRFVRVGTMRQLPWLPSPAGRGLRGTARSCGVRITFR